MGEPTAVVFDVGHVLIDWSPRYLYRQLIADPAALDWFLANVVTERWHFQHDAGRPFAETSAELIAQHPEHRALIEAFGPRWLDTIPGEMPGMGALVDELVARSVPLYAITNFSAEFWPRTQARYPILQQFRAVVVSGEERLMKPYPEIYALAMQRFGLKPGEGVFIDDKPANANAADAAGLIGHVFTGAPDLRGWLERRGLL